MIDKDTDFLKITNNFAKTASISSIQIIKSNLDFTPKVTIAIPTYKRVALLKEAIDSAINQLGYEFYDIIVVDNDPERGCETEKLLLSYNDKRIAYYKNSENIGMAGNWNRLFELALGDYVVMLHDDDLILSSFLSECMCFVDNKRDIGILRPVSQLFNDTLIQDQILQFEKDSNIIRGRKWRGKFKRIFDIDNCLSFALGPPTGCLFNKKAVFDIGGYNADFFPSLDYCFALLFSCHYKVFVLKKTLTLYRWGVNESLNISTRKAFVTDAYYLRKFIFKKYGLPKYIADRYLYCFIDIHKDLNFEFEFDESVLSHKKINIENMALFSSIIWVYMKMVKAIKYKIGIDIW
ncbi:glycosyltransferase family A protein [Flavobacterium praedii]|uniref:glycosyltransferase family A protein n=1 Tax=Flavobacterium praedii TaxID=3002900 RepID=UPI0024820735|nr:glycosyltransferase family A protein [Flavobacterium praedii]